MKTAVREPARVRGKNGAAGFNERFFRRALVSIAAAGLVLGVLAWGFGRSDWADWCWAVSAQRRSWQGYSSR